MKPYNIVMYSSNFGDTQLLAANSFTMQLLLDLALYTPGVIACLASSLYCQRLLLVYANKIVELLSVFNEYS